MSVNAALLSLTLIPCECCDAGCDCGCLISCPRHRERVPHD